MLKKCANPQCVAQFSYFSEGKLFEFGLDPVSGACVHPRRTRRPSEGRELFWLCASCAATLTLECQEDGSVTVVPAEGRRIA